MYPGSGNGVHVWTGFMWLRTDSKDRLS